MRLLIVLSSNARRGAEIEGLRLAAELSARGLDATAVALAPTSVTGATIDVEIVGAAARSPRTWRALRRRARRSDIVVAYGAASLPACAIGLLGAQPFVYRSIGTPADWIRGSLHRERTAAMLRRARHVVALWPEAAQSICDLYRIPPSRISVIGNARSSKEFHPASSRERQSARTRLGLGQDAFVVACVGAITPEKQIALAVDGTSHVPGATLVVAGDGPLRADVEARAAERLPDRYIGLGAVADVTPVYHAADVVLLVSRSEGMPGTVIEAAMSRVPVVATAVGAVPWLFGSGVSGTCLSPDPDPVEVAAALVSASRRSPTPDTLPTDQFDWNHVAAHWLELLVQVSDDAGRT